MWLPTTVIFTGTQKVIHHKRVPLIFGAAVPLRRRAPSDAGTMTRFGCGRGTARRFRARLIYGTAVPLRAVRPYGRRALTGVYPYIPGNIYSDATH